MTRNNTPQEYIAAGYTPGSAVAALIGCTCKASENNEGRGFILVIKTNDILFMVDPSCPLHGESPCKLDPGLKPSKEGTK